MRKGKNLPEVHNEDFFSNPVLNFKSDVGARMTVETYLLSGKVDTTIDWELKKLSFIAGSVTCRLCDSDRLFNFCGPHFPNP